MFAQTSSKTSQTSALFFQRSACRSLTFNHKKNGRHAACPEVGILRGDQQVNKIIPLPINKQISKNKYNKDVESLRARWRLDVWSTGHVETYCLHPCKGYGCGGKHLPTSQISPDEITVYQKKTFLSFFYVWDTNVPRYRIQYGCRYVVTWNSSTWLFRDMLL